MGNERSLPPQPLLPSVGINLDLYFKPIREKGMEKEVMISFKVLDPNSLMGKPLEAFKNGKVFRKRERPGSEKNPL